jgi:Fur family zinc uptake transcriptional regulator
MTRNQSLVYGALCEAEGPLSAYTILDKLRQNGLRAPLQVYRALEKLVESGRVHRLESLNAFVACRRSDCATHASIAFTICEDCGLVREVADDGIEARLADLALNAGFTLRRSVVELRGLCAKCTVRQAVSG